MNEPLTDTNKNKDSVKEILRFVIIALLITLPIRFFIAQPFIVSGASMADTFHNSDYLIIDQVTYNFKEPERGDVVVFKYPLDKSKFFIKRIVGTPGETVTIKDGVVTITNQEEFILEEPYIKSDTENFNNLRETKINLKDDEYFVMGDNRKASSDSRTWGPVPEKNITGRVFLKLYPVKETSLLPGHYNYQK